MRTASDGVFYVVTGEGYDADLEVLFASLRELGHEGRRVNALKVTSRFTESGTSFHVGGEEIRPALVLGWVDREYLIRGCYLLEAMERSGIPIVNTARTLFCAQNKYLLSEALHRNKVPHLPVLSGFSAVDLEHWIQTLKFPLVLKPVVGDEGRSILKIETPNALREIADMLANFQQSYYVQPYLENPGRDIRVVCVNFRAVHGYYRYAAKGKWITNIMAGGHAERVELTPELVDISERAARAVGAPIAGIDVGEDVLQGGYRIYEVNSMPTYNLKWFMPQDDDIIARRIAQFLVETARAAGTL